MEKQLDPRISNIFRFIDKRIGSNRFNSFMKKWNLWPFCLIKYSYFHARAIYSIDDMSEESAYMLGRNIIF